MATKGHWYAWASICVVFLAGGQAIAQDKKATAAPPAAPKAADAKPAPDKGGEQAKVIVENDRVRVTETTYKPGAATAMRERPARVARSLTDGKLEKVFADGRKEVLNLKAGDVRYLPKETYVQKNIGTKDYVTFTVNLKDTTAASRVDAKKSDAPKAEAKDAKKAGAPDKGGESRKMILENERVSVTENTYKPGSASAMRERGARVSRALTDATMEKAWADGKKETLNWKKGDVRYLPKETFIQKNIGKGDFVVYTVTLK